MSERRYRQVHLDFHTSADCEDVGAEFDPEVFAETVETGRVDSMTVFAKCHHGFSYYPTEVGTPHPNLAVPDLMGAQIESLHGIGVRAPIYVSVMWDDLAGEKEPGWIVARRDGSLMIRPPLSAELARSAATMHIAEVEAWFRRLPETRNAAASSNGRDTSNLARPPETRDAGGPAGTTGVDE